ncbi:hypothetical protein ACFL35_00825 [Candidatus Riflebacteria bacterium]
MQIILAWLLFFTGFAIELAIDYYWRLGDGNIHTGGFPEPFWFGIPFLLAAISAWIAFKGSTGLSPAWKRYPVLAVQLILGFFLYAFICAVYITGAGID